MHKVQLKIVYLFNFLLLSFRPQVINIGLKKVNIAPIKHFLKWAGIPSGLGTLKASSSSNRLAAPLKSMNSWDITEYEMHMVVMEMTYSIDDYYQNKLNYSTLIMIDGQ